MIARERLEAKYDSDNQISGTGLNIHHYKDIYNNKSNNNINRFKYNNSGSINDLSSYLSSRTDLLKVFNYKTPTMQIDRKIGNLETTSKVSLTQLKNTIKVSQLDNLDTESFGQMDNHQYLDDLINYYYDKEDELYHRLGKFNDAIRVDILTEHQYKLIKNPYSMIIVLNYLSSKYGKKIGYGLKHHPNRGKSLFVPFTMQFDETRTFGIFYIDQNRPLSVKNILAIEKVLQKTNLSGAHIIANKVGLPAKKFIERLNNEINSGMRYEIFQFDSLVKKSKEFNY